MTPVRHTLSILHEKARPNHILSIEMHFKYKDMKRLKMTTSILIDKEGLKKDSYRD